MKIDKTLILAALILAVAGASAEESESYLTPGDMNDEDRTVMVQTTLSYEQCVRNEGMAKLDEVTDVRQAANAAMQSCDEATAPLRDHFSERGFHPDFVNSLDRRIKNRTIKRLLPELMAASASR
jgi:hypothetical protein